MIYFIEGYHTKEKIIRIWTIASYPEYLDQIIKLAVNVSDDSDWCFDVDDIALTHEKLLGLGAYRLDDGLGEEFLFVQTLDALVKVDRSCCSVRMVGGPPDRLRSHLVDQACWIKYIE